MDSLDLINFLVDYGKILLAVLGTTVIATTLVRIFYSSKLDRRSERRTSEKIDQLSNLLKSASTEIEKLEEELTSKSKKLQEQNDSSNRLDQLLSLKEEQAEAIKQELKSTLKESNRSNRLWTIVIGAMWFILGLIVRGFLGF